MKGSNTVQKVDTRRQLTLLGLMLLFVPMLGFSGKSEGKMLSESSSPRVEENTSLRVPVATDDAFNVVEGTSLAVAAPGVLENDTDAIDVVLENAPANGILQLNSDGSFTYEHNGQSTGADSFTYIASNGVTTDTATVTINVIPLSFGVSALVGHSLTQPTSLQFGPDSLLYALRKKGQVNIMKVERNAANDYTVVSEEVVTLARSVKNHNDDGTLLASEKNRQATGIVLAGTADNPVMYINSSDPRVGGNGGATDTGLDTNSGVISRISWIGTSRTDPGGYWEKVDIVRGMPRSEENHAPNGMALSVTGDTLFTTVGGFTNAGAPSNNFAFITEYALGSSILAIDLVAIDQLPTLTDTEGQAYKYDIPTLDDPTRANLNGIDDPNLAGYDGIDVNDPWGGNDGLNQAKWVLGGPVQVHAGGFRNPYDMVVTESGRMYAVDNGANGGWGGHPVGEGSFPGVNAGLCTNQYDPLEPGSSTPGPNDPQVNNMDNLHYVRELAPGQKYYAGHPTPVRGNPSGAGLYTGTHGVDGLWRDGTDLNNPLPADWPPVPPSLADPQECDFRNPGETDGAIATFAVSTNGLTEYTASNFNGFYKGDLLGVGYNNNTVYHIDLNAAGDQVLNNHVNGNGTGVFASNFGNVALDVTAQGDFDPFPGTVWVTGFTEHAIYVFEPADYEGAVSGPCTGASDPFLDEDGDGYDNEDEIQNGTNACSAASKPADFDKDLTSDLNDTDDDSDGVDDIHDAFQIDVDNGMTTSLPLDYPLLNEDPGTGFFGVGFTGVMANSVDDYLNLYDFNELIPGGTAGLFSVTNVPEGDARSTTNTQQNAFQVGINVGTGSGPFTARVRILGPFFDTLTPQDDQLQGFYIGTGDQDNYVAISLNAQGGVGGMNIIHEEGGVVLSDIDYPATDILNTVNLDLFLSVDPVAGTVQPKYVMDGGITVYVGSPISVSGDLLSVLQGTYQVQPGTSSAMAVGIIATSAGAGPDFNATWDHVEVTADPAATEDLWHTLQASTNPKQRHENAFVKAGDKFYLMGGRGNRKTNAYDPVLNTWAELTLPPIQIHHFQAVSLGDTVYIAGAYQGDFPNETPVPNIYKYDTISDSWVVGSTIPVARQRGSAGVVTYNGKIYMVSGSLGGHAGTASYLTMFDEYDPATDTWTTLADVPRGRDHFNAVVSGSKLYVLGGRAGSVSATVAEVDVYDFVAGTWSTLPSPTGDVPTPRGGSTAAAVGTDIFFLGGESGAQTLAHSEVEVLDTNTNTWRTLDALDTGRHGTQAVVDGTKIYIAAGSGEVGGGPEMSSLEVFERTSLSDPGTVLPSSLAATPATHDFGQLSVGSSAATTVTLSNTGGNQPISITGITGSGSLDYTISFAENLPHTLASGETMDVQVDFAPTAEGSSTYSIDIVHDGSNGTVNVPVSGEGSSGVLTDDAIYRVNAGGSTVADTPIDWVRDTKNKPAAYVNTGTGDNNINKEGPYTGPNNTGAPTEIFERNRWDPDGGEEMMWDFPVTQASLYDIRLYFREADPGNQVIAGRVFDILIEGAVVEDDYDIFADAGTDAVVKSYQVYVDDGNIDVDFGHVEDHPAIYGIEVSPVSGGVDLIASADSLDFFTVEVDSTSQAQSLMVTNVSNGSLDVTGVSITGTNASEFAHTFSGPLTVASGADASFDVTMTPSAAGELVASLEIAHTGANSPLIVGLKGSATTAHLSFLEVLIVGSGTVTLSPDQPLYNDGDVVTVTAVPDPGWEFDVWSGNAVGGDNPIDVTIAGDMTVTATFLESATTIDPLFRVNAGGGGVSDSPIQWDRDTKNKPSANFNDSGDNKTGKDAFTGVNATDAPSDVFNNQRWDPSGGNNMEWDFPVGLSGAYDVKLYFAETTSGTPNPGDRIFDVTIEGNLVLDDYDVVADVGYQTAVVKTFNIEVTDGNIDINFLPVLDNPFVSGIEIMPTPATVPASMRYNGKNTFLVRSYEQVTNGDWELIGMPLAVNQDALADMDPKPSFQTYKEGLFAEANALTRGHGYWMMGKDEQTHSFEGEKVDSLMLNLRAGWNLVSGPSCDVELSRMSGYELLVPQSLYRYDGAYARSHRLEQGRGYWVLAKEAGQLELNCAAATAVRSQEVLPPLNTFGRLLVRDANGNATDLQFGSQLGDGYDEQMFVLPPKAPGNGLDIRFGGDRWLIEETQGMAALNATAYPIEVELTKLPLQGADQIYVITALNGNAEVEIGRLKPGDILEINDKVDALQVQSLSDYEANLPESFALQGNYPNPFNPVTTIVFDLPEQAEVEVEIFDMLGRRVMTLGNQTMEAGLRKRVEFNGQGLASGVYLYRVIATMSGHTAKDTGKMIMLK